MQNISLTEKAHEIILKVLKKGDVAIDATAGNGHDTLFLAKTVGKSGEVYAFDIQQDALHSTECLLKENKIDNVSLNLICHSKMQSVFTGNKKIKAIMFNLGYLPGSNKSIKTQASTTLMALNAGIDLLADDGILTLICYQGHAGGKEECMEVERWLRANLKNKINYISIPAINNETNPILFAVKLNNNKEVF